MVFNRYKEKNGITTKNRNVTVDIGKLSVSASQLRYSRIGGEKKQWKFLRTFASPD